MLVLSSATTALLVSAVPAADADIGALQAKVEAARSQAGAIAAGLQASQSQLAAAQQQASAAAARQQQLSSMLARGQQHSAQLAAKVQITQRRLDLEQGHLRRVRGELAQRLVAIYESGSPNTAGIVLGSGDFNELLTQSEYLREIESSDRALAERGAEVRNAVRSQLDMVAALKARVDAYDARLALARSQISTAHQDAEASAARLQSITSARAASLASLKSNIGSWVGEIRTAQAAAAQRVGQAGAESTVERWLGGPYSIPSYIVMCESGRLRRRKSLQWSRRRLPDPALHLA